MESYNNSKSNALNTPYGFDQRMQHIGKNIINLTYGLELWFYIILNCILLSFRTVYSTNPVSLFSLLNEMFFIMMRVYYHIMVSWLKLSIDNMRTIVNLIKFVFSEARVLCEISFTPANSEWLT
ncbi:hypothetical protein SAMN02927897_01914 [Kosakonia sacchari]|uniref:Uncharacterized protein n=1 Tax=Kosakonia sacchari TaxID=1158459 RepID=A0A1G4Y3F6_9ENTR|nr:hypothetical protein SAMN02927897_01914 [Kosakonia sacchari]